MNVCSFLVKVLVTLQVSKPESNTNMASQLKILSLFHVDLAVDLHIGFKVV